MNKYASFGRQATALVREIGSAVSPSMPVPDAVDVGSLLWAVVDYADEHLEVIKDRLRREARPRGTGPHVFDGNGTARCQVVVPQPSPSVPDAKSLKDALDQATFDELFDTVVSYKPKADFANRLLGLPESQQRVILQRVRLSDPTPRVSFKTRESGH